VTAAQECQHEHVEDFIVKDPRLSTAERQVRYLKCVDCGLLTPDASQVPAPE
jgi:hypothetical protein